MPISGEHFTFPVAVGTVQLCARDQVSADAPQVRITHAQDEPVLSLRKLCEEHGYSCEWTEGQKPHLIKNGERIQCNTDG